MTYSHLIILQNQFSSAPVQFGDTITTDNAEPGFGYENIMPVRELEMYYYHPDHLGSVSMTSDINGTVSQYIEYIPFGEEMYSAHRNTYNTPYRYTAKELDEETGLYYYGARYYNPKLSIWLSADPMVEQRNWLSPYNYVQNNPIMRNDPTGALDDWIQNKKTERYEWRDEVTSKDNIPEGYRYVGKTGSYKAYNGRDIELFDSGEWEYRDRILNNVTVTAKKLSNIITLSSNNNTTVEKDASIIPYIGITLSIGDEIMFSEKFNTWMGKEGKIRSQDWGGYRTTGGKFKFARKTGKFFKFGGSIFGLYGIVDTEVQYQNKEISKNLMIIEQTSNAIGFIPLFGTAWSIGWNLGKDYGPSKWYGENDNKWFE